MIDILKEIPKALLYIITIATLGLFYGFYPKKWKKYINEVVKALYE